MEKKIKHELKKCEGCNQKQWCDIFAMDSAYVYGCPCRICLLKMLCNDACQEYNKNAATVYKDDTFIMEMKKRRRELRVAYNKNILRGEHERLKK